MCVCIYTDRGGERAQEKARANLQINKNLNSIIGKQMSQIIFPKRNSNVSKHMEYLTTSVIT